LEKTMAGSSNEEKPHAEARKRGEEGSRFVFVIVILIVLVLGSIWRIKIKTRITLKSGRPPLFSPPQAPRLRVRLPLGGPRTPVTRWRAFLAQVGHGLGA